MPKRQRLYAFADASDLALCYVIYLRTEMENGTIQVSFVAGNSMVIPRGNIVKGELSIPRAELCAADALAGAVMQIEQELDIPHLEQTLLLRQ